MTDADTGSVPDQYIFTIDVESATKTLSIYSDDIGDSGTYFLLVRVEYTDHPSINANTTFAVELYMPPTFVDELKYIDVKVGEDLEWTLPEIESTFPLESIEVDLG